jgi:hypothetical protein
MEISHSPRIIQIDRLQGGVAVTFEDERCGFFSPKLLYATLPQAVDLDGAFATLNEEEK